LPSVPVAAFWREPHALNITVMAAHETSAIREFSLILISDLHPSRI